MENTEFRRSRHTQRKPLPARIAPKKKEKSKVSLLSNVHKIYFLLALVLGLMLALFMPLFSEPDGQVHFTSAASIVGIYPDMTQYGEKPTTGGLVQQQPTYQNGSHFENYYLMKTQLLRQPANGRPSVLSWGFWGELVPAVGIWIGYHIYPSLGVMATFGRLLSLFLCTVASYFIVRSLKRGKLFFSALLLTPVVLNQFASLSYDAPSFVLVAAVIALSINTLEEGVISRKRLLQMVGLSIVVWFAAKTNFVLILLLFPLVLLAIASKKWRLTKGGKIIIAASAAVIFLVGFSIYTLPAGGPIDFLSRLFVTFVNNPASWQENQTPTTFISTFVAPYPRFNFMPVWLIAVWAVLLAASYWTDPIVIESRLVSFGAIGIFILNLFAIYYAFVGYKTSFVNGTGGQEYILGVQGRYTTPFYLLAALLPFRKDAQANENGQKKVLLALVIIATASSLLLLYNTLYGIIYLNTYPY